MAEKKSGMAEHRPGEMDISEQERTFAGFIRFTIWTLVIVILILIFLALVNA